MMRWLNFSLKSALLAGLLLFFTPPAFAHEVNFSLGAFYLGSTLKSTNKTGSSFSLGSYQLEYRKDLLSRFEVGLGYSVDSMNFVSSYVCYGFDLAVYYFPFTITRKASPSGDRNIISIESMEAFKPYLGISFNQRQLSNSSINFIGYGGIIGFKYALFNPIELNAAIRYVSVNGVDRAINIISGVAGISFNF